MPRLLRITTVPISLHLLLKGQFAYMRAHGLDVITISADGKEVCDVTQDGTQHIVVPLTRKITFFQDLKCLWLLIREMKKLRPDIVHTHTPKAGLLGMLAARICGVPIRLHTVAGLPLMEASGVKRRVLEFTEKLTYRCAHRVYPNSYGLKTFIENHFNIPRQKLKVIGRGSSNGIDTVFFERSASLVEQAKQIRVTHTIQDHDLVFSFVGRIVRDKGIVELVNAFKQVADALEDKSTKRPRLFLMLVGHFEEDLDPLPAETIKFLMNDRRVILAGFQSDIRPWLMASDVFVFPSYREGFPNVVMQASLLKVPCIVSNINGCNEIVVNDQSGIIIPPKDSDALAAAMQVLIANEEKRKSFASMARNYVATNFKREVIWEELKKEYEAMLKAESGKLN